MKYLYALTVAMTIVSCGDWGPNPNATPNQGDLSKCESHLDQSITASLRVRAVELEDQHRILWMDVHSVDSKFSGEADSIAVANISHKYGGDGINAVLANPIAGSMTYAAQKSWAKGHVVLPYTPNLIRQKESLTDSEQDHLGAAPGWVISQYGYSSLTEVTQCRYVIDVTKNPWYNDRWTEVLSNAWRHYVRGGTSVTIESEVHPVEGVHASRFVGPTDPVDSVLLRMMDKNITRDGYNFYPSIVGNVRAMDNARDFVTKEREILAKRGAHPVHTFWFEGEFATRTLGERHYQGAAK
jgi:hypothetical protein